jgi:hypothetical protein
MPMHPLRGIRTWLTAVVLAAGSITCGEVAEPPPPPQATSLERLNGDGQTGRLGQPLADSLVVLVKDQEGRPFRGALVSWAGTGSPSQSSVATSDDGRAAVQWVLGETVGTQTTTAIVTGLPRVVFSATAEAEPEPVPKPEPVVVRRLVIATQPPTEAASGVSLSQQPILRVEDATTGQPSGAGIAVTASAEGAIMGGQAVVESDESGAVRFHDLALAGSTGTYQITFSAAEIAPIRSRSISLRAGPVSKIMVLIQPPARALNREVFAPDQQPVVRLADEQENPVENAIVTAETQSGGRIEGTTTATTGLDGVASFPDLGISGTGSFTIRFSSGSAGVSTTRIEVAPLTTAASVGRWGPVIDWAANGADIVPLHLSLLPTGKLLAWGRMGQPWVWTPPTDGDPAGSGMFREVPADTMIFCAGHAFLPNGRLLVSGGHLEDDRGLEVTHTFDPFTERWSGSGELPSMAQGRWYPTVTSLADGRAVTVAGRDTAGITVAVPELWEGNQWVRLTGAAKQFPYYPKNFVAPDGRVFYAGERIQSWWLDVDATTAAGRGQWLAGPSHVWQFNRDYGSAVMYRPGKVLYVGGGGDAAAGRPRDVTAAAPTNTAEVIDLNATNPVWSNTGAMQFPRRHLNATVLPDGQVLVTGGVNGAGFNSYTTGVREAEMWNPATGMWTTLSANAVNRAYHAVSLLLPSGAVLHGASGDAAAPRETSHEIFQPPYLFRGNRPTITSAPSTAGYGQQVELRTSYWAQITSASLIRLPSVTHTFDQNTRFLPLTVTRTAGKVMVRAPSNPNVAPPGHYLLFVLNRNGVPSEGRVIQLQ